VVIPVNESGNCISVCTTPGTYTTGAEFSLSKYMFAVETVETAIVFCLFGWLVVSKVELNNLGIYYYIHYLFKHVLFYHCKRPE
jgi:hypothetical protein